MTDSVGAGMALLTGATGISLGMGWHMAASIGGADMPVVITLLNRFFFFFFFFFFLIGFSSSTISFFPFLIFNFTATLAGRWLLRALCSTMICWLLLDLLSVPLELF